MTASPSTSDPASAPRDPTQTIRPHTLSAPRDAQLPAARIGGKSDPDFVVANVIGRGGMGIVEAASQTSLGREVALKRLVHPDDEHGFRALLREARITSRLQHPGIVPVHAVIHDEQLGPVVVMKHLEGQTWRQHLVEHGADTDPRGHARIAIEVCYALEYAHSKQVLHLDVKPDNVILGNFGEVWLVDWGIALDRAEEPARIEVLGTPAYMAPEMVHPEITPISERTDVYLLGACLYEALYGEPPHRRADSRASMVAAANEIEFPDDSIGFPTELVGIVRQALAPSPCNRFGSVRELRDALTQSIEHEDAERLVTRVMTALKNLDSNADHLALEALEQQLASALSLWPESPRGLATQAQLRRTMIEQCLNSGDLHTAQRIAEQLPNLTSRLREQLDRLIRTRQLEQEAHDRRAAAGHGRDAARHSFLRQRLAGFLVLVFLAMPPVMFVIHPGSTPSPAGHLLLLATLPSLFWGATVWTLRRRLMSNYVNRAATSAISVAFVCVLLNRSIGVLGHTEPSDILVRELFLLAGIMAAQSSLHRVFVGLGLMYASAWTLGMIEPSATRYVYNLAVALNAVVLYRVWHQFDEIG